MAGVVSVVPQRLCNQKMDVNQTQVFKSKCSDIDVVKTNGSSE
jgi:hypothetical protein